MQIRKAVITAAAPDQSTIPLQQLVDAHGNDKTALQLIIEETLSAGVEEICVVIAPGNEASYRKAAGDNLGCLHFVPQTDPDGYADALHRAKDFVGDDAFLHLVGDHLYLSNEARTCAKQLVEIAKEFQCSVSAVQPTRESRLPYFGVVTGTNVPRFDGAYEVSKVIEKPTPTEAEQELVTAGLRSGNYLGFFGMHVLTADVMKAIVEVSSSGESHPTLSDALAKLPSRGRYVAYRVAGKRYNIGVKYGLLIAQLAIGLAGRDRDQILTELVELMATRDVGGAS